MKKRDYKKSDEFITTENEQKDTLWTYSDRLKYSNRNNDPTLWDLDMLKDDLNLLKQINWPTKTAISNYPSPVAEYDWGVSYTNKLNVEIQGKQLKGLFVANAKDKYRVLKDSSDFFKVKFNLLYLTDLPDEKKSANSIISRNYPHYLSTGKQITSQGEIDWVQMDMADGRNFAIINQRYFDLEFGRTIVVGPQRDGSLRFLQLDISPNSFAHPFDDQEKKKVQKFYQELRINETLKDLLNNENTIEQSF